MTPHAVARHAALEVSRTGVCLFDSAGELVFFNSAWSAMVGPESEHGERWQEFVGMLIADLAALADAGGPPALQVLAADERRLALAASELADGGIVLSVDDVTERERELVARDRLLGQVVGAQDVEARRIAELLHDDAVQRLTALSVRLELFALERGDAALGELAREAGAVTASLRRLLVDLHPALLDSQGLQAAVEVAAEPLRQGGVEVVVQPLPERLPAATERLAYRLIQEALANALRHAGASRVRVAFALTPRSLHCRIVDDGRGFDAAAEGDSRVGFALARRRAELAGGRLTVESRPGAGTAFAFELPVTP